VSGKGFVHLHVHTDYSKLDGMETVKEVAQFAADDGQPAMALTDHGNMSGYIKFEQACDSLGVNPIPGIEAYYVDSFARAKAEQDRSRQHMLLLGVSDAGYRNLLKISSRAYLEQQYYKPLVDDALIAQYSEGLVMTTGCIGGPIGQAILRGENAEAEAAMGRYRDMVAPGNFFAEIQVHDFPEQTKVNQVLVPMAKRMGIPLIASQDAHYTRPDRALAHERMLAMQTNATMSDPKRFKFASHSNFLTTAEEMRRMVPEDLYPGACDNTLVVAEMASGMTRQTGSKYLIPEFPDAKEFGGEQKMLRELVIRGAERRYGRNYSDKVASQIDYELGVIHEMGFDAYFLIVWDFIRWGKEDAGIYVGPGRGSAAGSIVSFALDITTIDPIKYGLYFERFLNPGRKSMPDIDIDVERDRRYEVREYIKDKYGEDHVAYIATQGLFHGRSAIKGAARLYEVKATEANALSSTFPQKTTLTIGQLAGSKSDLPSTGDDEKDDALARQWDEGADFRRALSKGDDRTALVLESASDVEGYLQNFGVHAAGVLITPRPLTDYVPLTTETKDKTLAVCGYDKDDAEAIGGLKMDLLGLVNLTTVRACVEQVKANTGIDVDINNLPLDDKKTFALLQRADTAGVFQLASTGIKELLRRLQPDRFEDIAAVLALYRPGPMGSDMHWDFADRKNGRQKITAEHPDMLLPHLFGETHGQMIYQEQLISMVQHFAGFSAGEADSLRKATGKKNAALIASMETKFKEGMIDNDFSAALANKLWAKIPPFAQYSFNKSHAVAYAMVSYQTAYLKANFPAEYAAACIDTLDDPAAQMQWAKGLGVAFQVPDVNESLLGSRAFEGAVRLGLQGVKGLGPVSCAGIIDERHANGPYKSVADFMVRTAARKSVNKNSVMALIESGALDSLNASRGALATKLPELLLQAKAAVPASDDGWGDDDGGLLGDIEAPPVLLNYDADQDETALLSERLGRQVARLGVFLGVHPMTLFKENLMDRVPQISEPVSGSLALGYVTMHGVISGIEVKDTKRSTLTTVTLESEDGYSLPAKCFGDADDIVAAGLGSLLVVAGTLQEDEWRATPQGSPDGDDDTDTADEEPPREFLADSWMVFPLAALDRAGKRADEHNVLIEVADADVSQVAAALAGRLTPGLRMLSIATEESVTVLPQPFAETAEALGEMLAHLPLVTVSRA